MLGLIPHLAASLLLIAAAPAVATTFTLSTSDNPFEPGVANQGWWYRDGGLNSDVNDNYLVGTTLTGTTRNFFTFDLAALPTDFAVTSATLRLQRYFSSENNEAVETIQFFDVSTDAATLNDNIGANAAIYDDLGSGTSYGEFGVPGADPPTFVVLEFSLNAAALADIEGSFGGFFSIGGTLVSDDGNDFLFGQSTDNFVQELVVVAVPEPSTSGLLLLGLLGLARKRRTRA